MCGVCMSFRVSSDSVCRTMSESVSESASERIFELVSELHFGSDSDSFPSYFRVISESVSGPISQPCRFRVFFRLGKGVLATQTASSKSPRPEVGFPGRPSFSAHFRVGMQAGPPGQFFSPISEPVARSDSEVPTRTVRGPAARRWHPSWALGADFRVGAAAGSTADGPSRAEPATLWPAYWSRWQEVPP